MYHTCNVGCIPYICLAGRGVGLGGVGGLKFETVSFSSTMLTKIKCIGTGEREIQSMW